MAKAKTEIPLIGGGMSQSRDQTPEERIQLTALLAHQLIEGLTGLSLRCSNLTRNLCGTCAEKQMNDLQAIEQATVTVADIARQLVHCTQARNGKIAGDGENHR